MVSCVYIASGQYYMKSLCPPEPDNDEDVGERDMSTQVANLKNRVEELETELAQERNRGSECTLVCIFAVLALTFGVPHSGGRPSNIQPPYLNEEHLIMIMV